MKSIEIQAKSVDEAIFKGLDQLGLSIDEVDIEIIEEGGKRFFGMGTKQCVIRLTERDRETVDRVLEQQAEAERERKEQREARRAERPPRRRDGVSSAPCEQRPPHPARDADEAAAAQAPRPSQDGRPRTGTGARRERAPRRANWGQPVEGGPEADFLRGVLERMGLQARVDCFADDQCLYMRVSGDNMGVLIGRRGDTLNALQYLTSLVANRAEGPYKRVVVDTENYRLKREQTLERLAKRMAEQVERTGNPLSLEPMNPYERRVMHATLQQNPRVRTHSEGEEPHRHVVITKK